MSKFFITQDPADKALERKHSVYIRSCKVVDRATGQVVREGLHYLDAFDLKTILNNGGTAEDFRLNLNTGGHPSAAHLLSALSRW